MPAQPLKTEDLTPTLEKPGVVLIDCWAPWCAPCRAFTPIFERVSERHPDAKFLKVNVDEEPEIARAFGVRGIPTLVVFRDGVPLMAQAGMLPEPALDDLVKQVKALDMDAVRKEIALAEQRDASADRGEA